MADDADQANEITQEALDESIRAAREEVPEGKPGDCDMCGEWSGRLVQGACAPCRDKYRLP